MSPRRVKPLHGDRFVHRPSHTPTVWAAEPAPAKKRPAHTAESFVIGGQRRAADHDGNVHTAPSWRLTGGAASSLQPPSIRVDHTRSNTKSTMRQSGAPVALKRAAPFERLSAKADRLLFRL